MSTEDWKGDSGKTYRYHIQELPWRPDANQDGNYIFAKQISDIWHAVYIGQGDLRDRYDAAKKEGCVDEKGATHYHSHLNGNKASRTSEEKDLIAGNPECEWPTGCNGHDKKS